MKTLKQYAAERIQAGENPILCPDCQGVRIRTVTKDGKVAEYCPACDKWQGDKEARDQSLLPELA